MAGLAYIPKFLHLHFHSPTSPYGPVHSLERLPPLLQLLTNVKAKRLGRQHLHAIVTTSPQQRNTTLLSCSRFFAHGQTYSGINAFNDGVENAVNGAECL